MSMTFNELPQPDVSPPSKEERIFINSPNGLCILNDLRRWAGSVSADHDGFRAVQHEIDQELAPLKREHREQTDGRLPTINVKYVASLETKIDKLEASKADNAAKYEARR